uniref:Uncharacterized protein n=1 Tax=Gopherus evgoodei TaxID=1825980 RepID=A0A8C4YI36_9SAUR
LPLSIPGRGPMNAVNVENASLRAQAFLNMRESTQGRGPMNAMSVGKAPRGTQPMLAIRESSQLCMYIKKPLQQIPSSLFLPKCGS